MTTVKEIFEIYEKYEFMMVQPGGNQGDSMIYAGARKLADEVGLDHKPIYCGPQSVPPKWDSNKIIYLHGGGGFCTWWNWTPRLLKSLRIQNPKNIIIVGPTTVAIQDWYLKKYIPPPKNIIFFAREVTTAKYVQQHFFPDHTAIDHDTALHLKMGDEYLTPLLDGHKPEKLFKFLGVREDPESLNAIPESIDTSQFKYVIDPCQTNKWAWFHVKASEIMSNRCHSAILGLILKKPTTIFAGHYHKNKSMWEYSLKDKGVKWID